MLTAALLVGFGSDSTWRLSGPGGGLPPLAAGFAVFLGIALAVALAVPAGLAVLGVKGPLAVCRVEWRADGEWRITRPDGRCETALLSAATATLGPWILLSWTTARGRSRPWSSRYALIGAGQVSETAFRALKARLSTLPARQSGRAGAAAP